MIFTGTCLNTFLLVWLMTLKMKGYVFTCFLSLQIALGLEYLHGQKIVYRDLKSDNILVCSLDPNDTINVKISDYGISKFTTSQGMTGMVGTPGYMAPEIMDGQAYNEKVCLGVFFLT